MKSTFSKYLVAFITIIFISFFALSWIFTSMLRSYSRSESDAVLRQVASAVSKPFEANRVENVERYVQTDYPSGAVRALRELHGDVDIIITDENGKVLLSSIGKQPSDSPEILVDLGYINLDYFSVYSEDNNFLTHIGTINGFIPVKSVVYAKEIHFNDDIIGYSISLRTTTAQADMMNVVYKALISSSLWVMLAAVIAVYFITERIVHPLKQMTRATSEYAQGNFEKRIKVVGRDEVSELAVSFNKMADALMKMETMRNTFLANVSHDLRTPMTTISGFIAGITSGAIPQEKHAYYLGIIQSEVHRLSRLVSEILDISRLESGERQFNFVEFDIAEVSRLILISFEQKIEEKQLDVEFVSEDSVFVVADKDSIYQVMYNLCHNAIKFARVNGKFRIEIESKENNMVRVSVFDEGQPIAEEDLTFVFDRFYKTDKSRGLDKNGVGLGLYICKTIIDQHNTTIGVKSNEDSCEFFFELKLGTQKPKIYLPHSDI